MSEICDNPHVGLSKRELYAAMAMQGMLASPIYRESPYIVEWAVKQADALILGLARTRNGASRE